MAPRLSQGIGPAGRQPPVGGTGEEVLAGFGLLPTQHMGLDFHKLTFLHELGQAREDTCLTLARLFWAAGVDRGEGWDMATLRHPHPSFWTPSVHVALGWGWRLQEAPWP